MEEHGASGAGGGGLRPQPPPGRFPGRAVPTSLRRAVSREAMSQRSLAAVVVRAPEPTTADDAHAIPSMVVGWGFADAEAMSSGLGTGGAAEERPTQPHLPHLNPLLQQQRNNPLLFARGNPQHRAQVRMNPTPSGPPGRAMCTGVSVGHILPPPHLGLRCVGVRSDVRWADIRCRKAALLTRSLTQNQQQIFPASRRCSSAAARASTESHCDKIRILSNAQDQRRDASKRRPSTRITPPRASSEQP